MTVERKYIYDLLTRIAHAGIAFSILGLIITAKLAKINFENGQLRHLYWVIHIGLGFSLTFFFSIRIFWLFFGPAHAHWKSFIFLESWKKILTFKQVKEIKWNWGHHPIASVLYLIIFGFILISIVSGHFLSRIQFDLGLIDEKYFDDLKYLIELSDIHSVASNVIIIFIILHLYSLISHKLKDNIPIFSSIITGYQYKKIKKEIR